MAKYYYNGILLPDIPAEHLATNPYIFIRDNSSSGYYDLIMCSGVLYYSSNSVQYNSDSTAIQYMYRLSKSIYLDATEWEFVKEVSNSYFNISSSQVVLWSNVAILNSSSTSSTIYFPRCERLVYTDGKLLFNDVELPAFPTEHLSSNPYVFIRKNNTSGFYDLVLGASAWYYDSSNICVYPSGTDSSYWYKIPIVGSESYIEWEYYKSTTGYFGLDSERTLFWSLQDIPNGKNSSTIYFVATYPTPTITNTTKYLVRDSGKIYTVVDGALSEITGTLNADLFINSGADAIPDGALLMTLSNPEVLCWTDSDKVPALTATVKGIPEPQIVMSKEIDLMHSSIKGINGVTVDCKGDVLFAVSFDKKATWMMHNGTEFVEVSDKLAGMTKTEFEAITAEQWQPKYEASSDIYIRCILFDETQSITTLNIDFIN